MDERLDYQQQLEQDERRRQEDEAWGKHWRETWKRWAEQPTKEHDSANGV